MLRLRIAVALMLLAGATAVLLPLTGKGGHAPAVPLVLGITALGCGAVLTVLMALGSRRVGTRRDVR
ncbi:MULTISPECIES: hypothetical protein [unclassified Streptomyces]|uniref:hypothetical protein n=1 Tax=unclassified Streptomyces TaxID=2593676 RepID=UPI0004C21FA4|nr:MULTISPECIES: hypothetical protein [unclassified Streptomyces]KOX11543.1 hypothetical protein ADL04_01305 [Streptomyces sp. NRRL B-3648]